MFVLDFPKVDRGTIIDNSACVGFLQSWSGHDDQACGSLQGIKDGNGSQVAIACLPLRLITFPLVNFWGFIRFQVRNILF